MVVSVISNSVVFSLSSKMVHHKICEVDGRKFAQSRERVIGHKKCPHKIFDDDPEDQDTAGHLF